MINMIAGRTRSNANCRLCLISNPAKSSGRGLLS